MPRAHRIYQPGLVWHITHRCHNRAYLLKFKRDRLRWKHWLFQARKRFGLSVLNYIVTSNHIHLLVRDKGEHEIARGLQLIAGRTAQEYNRRKSRKGAFWEDRYFATAVATDRHLIQCLVYIDLNMVRAGVVEHPSQWDATGYHDIQCPPRRYSIIDCDALCSLTGSASMDVLQCRHSAWIVYELSSGCLQREPRWTDHPAVGPDEFLAQLQGASTIKS